MSMMDFLTEKNSKIPTFYTSKYISLGVSVFCAGIMIFVFPILYIQICNIIYNKTSRERYAYNRNGIFSSLSSSSSIYIKDSEDWSYYSKKIEQSSASTEIEDGFCCYRRKRKNPHLNRSSNINEEPEQEHEQD